MYLSRGRLFSTSELKNDNVPSGRRTFPLVRHCDRTHLRSQDNYADDDYQERVLSHARSLTGTQISQEARLPA